MRIAGEHLAALRILGYTDSEACFLYLVATHSGYFVPRQFLNFSGARSGKRTSHFTTKLESRGHVSWSEHDPPGGVYRLCSKELYARIGKAGLCTCRPHSQEFIESRLIALDFVIANQQHEYLETEDQKVSYFSEKLGIPQAALPARAYNGSTLFGTVQRYFADQYPIFLECGDRAGLSVALTYIDPMDAGVARFKHHLETYEPFLSKLCDFRFLYLSKSTMNFAAAERCFGTFSSALRYDPTTELIRYLKMRARHDGERSDSLSVDEMEWLGHARRRFDGEQVERLYAAWRAGEVAETETLAAVPGIRRIRFQPCLVPRESKPVGRIG
jgi:hypothetical protein